MKISFNDKSLQTTFEYPSESSLVQEEEVEAEEEEEEEGEEGEEEDEKLGSEEKPFTLFLPRATFVSGVGPESPWLPEGSSGECPMMGSWEGVVPGPHVHVSVCPCTCSLAHRPVQLYSKALHGLQQVAGADTGAGSKGGRAPTQGGHGELAQQEYIPTVPRAIWWGTGGRLVPRQIPVASFCPSSSAHTCQSERPLRLPQ